MCTTLYKKIFIFLFQLWKELIIKVVKEVDEAHHHQQQSRAAPWQSDVNTQQLLGHLSFPFVHTAPSDVFPQPVEASYSNISETYYDGQHKVQGIYGTQSFMHSKQATSTVSKSSSHGISSGRLVEAPTTATSLQNIFKPVGGGGGK